MSDRIGFDRARTFARAKQISGGVVAVAKSIVKLAVTLAVTALGAFLVANAWHNLLLTDAALVQIMPYGTLASARAVKLIQFGGGMIVVMWGFSALDLWRESLRGVPSTTPS